jgi:WD40 repeat protein
VLSFRAHAVDLNFAVFSDDGTMLATTGDDGAVRVWDPTTGEELAELAADRETLVVGPVFSPDGSRVAAAFPHEGLARVMAVPSGEVVAKIKVPEVPFGTGFSPDGDRLAIGSWEGRTTTVVDPESGETLLTIDMGSDVVGAFDLAWSPDGQRLATAGNDGAARIWDAGTGALLFTATGHSASIRAVDWSPDGARLATGSDDGTARIWEITDEGARAQYTLAVQDMSSGVVAVAFSPDGGRLMTGDNTLTAVKIWDARAIGGAEWANVAGESYRAAEFTSDGRSVLVSDGGVAPVEVETGARLQTITEATDDGVAWFALSGDGTLLATVDRSDTSSVDVWDVATGERRFDFSKGGTWVADVSWSRDSEVLAVAYDIAGRGDVTILDRSGGVAATLSGEPGSSIGRISLSPDGGLLAMTNQGARISPNESNTTIWDWERSEVVLELDTQAYEVAFDPTGSLIATNRTITGNADIWDAETGARVATVAAPAPVNALAFSPEGTSLATGHTDGSVRLWDAETGAPQLVLGGDSTAVGDVAFSPDGSKLASTGYWDHMVRIWALDLDDLITMANERLTRSLSDDECRQYLHVERCPPA